MRNGPGPAVIISPFTTRLVKASGAVLASLCDLQILTGASILVAGLATLDTASYYHQQIIVNLWLLTLTSFFVARVELDRPHAFQASFPDSYALSNDSSTRILVRRIMVFLSVLMGIIYEGIINMNQARDWDVNREGKCFVNPDPTVNWPWLAGLCLYAFALFMTLTPWTRPWVFRWLEFLHSTILRLRDVFRSRWMELCPSISSSRSSLIFLRESSRYILRIVASALLLILFWCFAQVMAILSFGDGFYPLLFAACTGFTLWSTYDIFALKYSNADLMVGEENAWGFGQILPMLLISSIGFQAVDAWATAVKKA